MRMARASAWTSGGDRMNKRQANDENGELIEDYIDIPMNFCPNCGRDLRGDKL